VKNLNFAKKLMGQYEDYNVLAKTISDILAHASDYDWSTHTKAAVYRQLNYLNQGKLIMDAAFKKCKDDFVGCTDNSAATSLKSFNAIMMDLPFELWKEPKDCFDLQRLLGARDTDGASVSLGGDETRPFRVACRRMDTSEPETYLELDNTSGSVSTPSYNSAVNVNADGAQVASVYRKVRVNVNHDNLEVVYDQADAVSSSGETQVRLGNAEDCAATVGSARSNIDLTGTIFTIAPSVSFQSTLAPAAKYEWVETKMSFDEAKAFAESKGGRLVEIDDAIEFATLREEFLAHHATTPSWVGMRRLDMTATGWKQFKWIYKNTAMDVREYEAYFHSGEPNNSGGNEACTHFWSDGMFNDVPCNLTYPFYIEYDYAVPVGTATFNNDRTAVDVAVSGAAAGKCAKIRPVVPIRLIAK
jgi:hypothetical protein